LPSHVTKHPKCLHIGECAMISSSSLNTQATLVVLDSYQPSSISTTHSTRCGSSVISLTSNPTFCKSPAAEDCSTGSTAKRSIGVSIPAAINPPVAINV